MTTLLAALSGTTLITTLTAPSQGQINTYNAGTYGGNMALSLPALSTLNVGSNCIIEKDTQDTSAYTVTFTASGGDSFYDLSTTVILVSPGEKRRLEVISISGTKYWKLTDISFFPRTAIATSTGQVQVSNTGTLTQLIGATLPNAAPVIQVGSMYRIALYGTIQTTSTSGTLTFTPYFQNTALAQTAVMGTQTSANAASGFFLEFLINCYTTGSSGTAIATPYGLINLATSGVIQLTSNSSSTTTVNTTNTGSNALIAVKAQWQTANGSNTLNVNASTIERLF